MSAPTVVQSTSGSQGSTTDLTLTLNGCTAGNYIVVLLGTWNNNPLNITTTGYTARGYQYVDPYGIAAYTLVASSGTNTFTAGKNASSCSVAAVMYEISGVTGIEANCSIAQAASGTNSSVTMAASTTVDSDLLLTWLTTREAGQVTPNSPNTTNATFVNDVNVSNAGAFIQVQTAKASTSTNAAFTGGWPAMTNTNARPWISAIIAIKGTTNSPTISGLGASSAVEGGSLTIVGTNLKDAGNSTATLGGVSQTVSFQSATSPQITVVLGTNLFGTATNVVVTNSTGTASNAYSLSGGVTPPAGYNYVTIGTPNATSANRITAVADIATGNQIEWDNASAVSVYQDGTFSCSSNISSFKVRVGISGEGWGAWADQVVGSVFSSNSVQIYGPLAVGAKGAVYTIAAGRFLMTQPGKITHVRFGKRFIPLSGGTVIKIS